MKIKQAKNIFILMVIAGLAAVGMIVAFLIIPSLREANVTVKDIIAAQTENEAQYANRRNLLKVIGDIDRIKEILAELNGQFLQPGQELAFIQALEAAGEQNDVKVTLTLSSEAVRGPVEELNRPFQLYLTGTFDNVFKSLIDVERMTYLTSIQTLSLTASGGQVTMMLNGLAAGPPKGL